jgi:hypothetical protein
MAASPLYTRVCGLEECTTEFQTDNARKMHCCKEHSNLANVRKWRKNHRKKNGGGGGGNGGGGASPTLFDTITPQSPDAFVPIPVIGHYNYGPGLFQISMKPGPPVFLSSSDIARAALN